MRIAAPGARSAGRNNTPGDGDQPEDRAFWPLALAGVRTAISAAGFGLAVVTILVVVGWIAAPPGGSRVHAGALGGLGLLGAGRTAVVIWLAGHHVTVQVGGAGRIGMLPLGLVLLPGALLWRAGRSVVRGLGGSGPAWAIKAGLAVAVPYSLLAGVLAAVSGTRLASASVAQALAAAFIIALVAAGFGAARAMAPWSQLGAHLTARTRSVLVGAAGSLAALGAAGALATAMTLASHVSQFGAVYGLLGPGAVGAGLLLLAQLGYLPNAVVWAIAYMLGPGFAVGAGTVVGPTGSVLGRLPAFPLLAVLPGQTHGAESAWLAGVILAMPYLAGVVGGLLVARTAPTAMLEAAPVRGFCSGALAGCVLGVLSAFAGGPLGDGRLAVVGPSAWQVGLLATLEVGIAAAVSAAAANWRYARSGRANQTAGGRLAADRPAVGQPGVGQRAVGRSEAAWPEAGQRGIDREAADGHVIYLDTWAANQPASQAARHDAGRPARRGPSALP